MFSGKTPSHERLVRPLHLSCMGRFFGSTKGERPRHLWEISLKSKDHLEGITATCRPMVMMHSDEVSQTLLTPLITSTGLILCLPLSSYNCLLASPLYKLITPHSSLPHSLTPHSSLSACHSSLPITPQPSHCIELPSEVRTLPLSRSY